MSVRGDIIRGAGGHLKRNTNLGVGIGHPYGGDEGEIRVQMVEGSPKLYARAGGEWYGINLVSSSSEELRLGDSTNYINIKRGNIEMTGQVSLLSSATRNVCIGVDNANKGTDNIIIGVDAGKTLLSSSLKNVCIGSEAGLVMEDNVGNIFIGHQSGSVNTSGDLNTCIGTFSGINHTGLKSTYIGYWAQASSTSSGLENEVVLVGGKTGASSGNGANTVTLGTDASTMKIYIGQAQQGVLKTMSIDLLERSSDPTEPAEGHAVVWMSDGTGKGADGDVMIASQAGGNTYYKTLFDHSASSANTW